MKITAGSLRGRTIPFNNKKFGGAEATPSKVKEAAFSMLGEYLSGKRFLDLYAGSGQMGLEALSRGAEFVVFNDSDARRVRFIGGLARQWDLAARSLVLHMPDAQCLRFMEGRGMAFDAVYLDPPYVKDGNDTSRYERVLAGLASHALLAPGGIVIVQHFTGNALPEEAGGLRLAKSRRYGTTSLAVYGE